MNIKEAKKKVREIGIAIEVTEYDEYRVNFINGKEATAYYTTDLQDAIDTAIAMEKDRKNG